MSLILNADDFGYDNDTVEQTIALMQAGIVKSATVMPNMPASELALRFARENPAFSFGVHLTFARDHNEGPLSKPGEISSLVDDQGRFWDALTVRRRAVSGRLRVDDICRELRLQLGAMLDSQVRLSHADSHHHLHKIEPFRMALAQVLPHFGLNRVRTAQNVFVRPAPWRPTYWLGPSLASKISRQFGTTDYFFMLDGDMSIFDDAALVRLATIDGTVEFGLHPGSNEPWRALETELAKRLAVICGERGVDLLGWRNISEQICPRRHAKQRLQVRA